MVCLTTFGCRWLRRSIRHRQSVRERGTIVAERIAARAEGRKQHRRQWIEAPMSIMYGQFFRSRPYADTDLPALIDLVAQANSDHTRTPYWHVGDVLWQMFRGPHFDATANIRLWHLDSGALVG